MTEKRALAVLSGEPNLNAFFNQLNEIALDASTRIEGLKKMSERIVESAEERKAVVWDEFEAYLKQNGFLPKDYSRKKQTLFIEDGVLFITDARQRSCDCIVCRLFGRG